MNAHFQDWMNRFCQKNHNWLIAFARRRLRRSAEAEDAVQQAYEQAWKWICKSRSLPRHDLGWFLTVLVRVVAHMNRNEDSIALGELEPASHGPAPDAPTLEREIDAAIHEALQTVREEDRVIFHLRLDGMSYTAIAHTTGRSAGAARIAFWRVKRTLRERLAHLAPAI
jgi:RNA polymerase sigma factor (sigma-70 family)